MQRRKCCSIVVLVLGIVLIVFGIIIIAILPFFIKQQVEKTVPLRRDSDGKLGETAQRWAHPENTFDVHMQFYLFNVTNPEEVMSLGAKPALLQHGPYAYKETQIKKDIKWAKDGSFVKYFNQKNYVFEPSLSCKTCRKTDRMTVPNVVLLLVAELLSEKLASQPELQPLVSLALMFESPFVTKPVGDLLYDGYYDFILNVTQIPLIARLLKGMTLPAKMGFFYGKNGANDSQYQIRTGLDDVDELGKIMKWNGSAMLPKSWWSTPEARQVKGTDGTLYQPLMSRDAKPAIYVSDICRSIYLVYDSDMDVQGIPGYRFTVPPAVFDSTRPENWGYCVNTSVSRHRFWKDQPQDCLVSGLLDVSNCQPGNPPIVISSPHFLFTTDEVVGSVQGLHPNLMEHRTTIDIEPTTGVGLHFQRRLQINVAMTRFEHMLQFQNVRNVVIPVVWLNESAVMTQETRDEIYSRVVLIKRLGYAAGWVMLALGLFLLLVLFAVFLVLRAKQGARKRLMGETLSSSVGSTPEAPRRQPARATGWISPQN